MMRTADGVGSPFLRGVSQANWGGPRPADPPECPGLVLHPAGVPALHPGSRG